jgi:protoheme IX farnesyltransferase
MLRAYYAALKPERTYANVMTTLAGFLFASRWHGNWGLLVATLVGTTLIVMSACAVNNCTDRSIDARMPRTKKRATVTGAVPVKKLAVLAIFLGLAGFGVLLTYVNLLTCLLGAIAYIDYVVLYAWSKRTTPWSTLIGTISGAVPLMAGYVAVTNQLSLTAWLLGLVMVFWQMVHFYAIAIFRRDDYAAGNLPVWSVRYGVKNTQLWMLLYALLYLLALIVLAAKGSAGWLLASVSGALGLYWLYLGVKGLRVLEPKKWARSMFGFSLITLMVLSGLLTVSPLL